MTGAGNRPGFNPNGEIKVKKIVRLKVHYTDVRSGAGNVPGETIGLPADIADALIARGAAVPVEVTPVRRKEAFASPTVKPAPVMPTELKGAAKKKWLIATLEGMGDSPSGTTLKELEEQFEVAVSKLQQEG